MQISFVAKSLSAALFLGAAMFNVNVNQQTRQIAGEKFNTYNVSFGQPATAACRGILTGGQAGTCTYSDLTAKNAYCAGASSGAIRDCAY